MVSLRGESSFKRAQPAFFAFLVFSFLSVMQLPFGSLDSVKGSSASVVFLVAYCLGVLATGVFMLVATPRFRARPSSTLCLFLTAIGVGLVSLYEASIFSGFASYGMGAFLIGLGSALLFVLWVRKLSLCAEGYLLEFFSLACAIAYSLRAIYCLFPYNSLGIIFVGGAVLLSALPLDQTHYDEAPSCVGGPGDFRKTSAMIMSQQPLFGGLICCIIWATSWGNALGGAFEAQGEQTALVIASVGGLATSVALLVWSLRRGNASPSLVASVGVGMVLLAWMVSMVGGSASSAAGAFISGGSFALLSIAFCTWSGSRPQASSSRFSGAMPGALALLSLVFLSFLALVPLIGARAAEYASPISSAVFFILFALSAGGHGKKTSPEDENATAGFQDARQLPLVLTAQYDLSEREVEVFLLFAKGHTATYISEQLILSPHTIKTYLKRIYGKLGVSSKEELIAFYESLMAH